jgi:hypothetical protein
MFPSTLDSWHTISWHGPERTHSLRSHNTFPPTSLVLILLFMWGGGEGGGQQTVSQD